MECPAGLGTPCPWRLEIRVGTNAWARRGEERSQARQAQQAGVVGVTEAVRGTCSAMVVVKSDDRVRSMLQNERVEASGSEQTAHAPL